METPREMLVRARKEEEEKQLIEIIDKPNLTPQELWLLSEDNFYKWRRKHDYPKLLNSFNEKIPSFLDWKSEYGLTDEVIMSYRVSDFVAPKYRQNDKTLYLLEQTYDGKKRTVVSGTDLSKIPKEKLIGAESFELILSFISYADWCKKRNKKFSLFNVTTRQASEHSSERVWLESGYELLKMGGIPAPVSGFGTLLRGKYLDFVNLCGLHLGGQINFGEEGNLELSYCAADNMVCRNLDMPLPRFWRSSINNISIQNSNIESWRFWECEITGSIIDSKLQSVQFFGGQFTPIIRGSYIIDVKASHAGFSHSNFSTTYSMLKKLYADQGEDAIAIEYFIREKELSREYSKGWQYLTKTINYYFWGYGRKPIRVIYSGFAAIIICGIIYYFFQSQIIPSSSPKSLWDCFYFSTVTFTTLGYGDLIPTGSLRLVAMVESFFGPLTLGFLVAGYSNTKY